MLASEYARTSGLVSTPMPMTPAECDEYMEKHNLEKLLADAVNEAVVWELQLKPGESRTLRFAYVVEHDRDARVSGFN